MTKKQFVMLGGYEIEKKLVDNYVELFIANQTTPPSLAMLELSKRLANLHKTIRETVGLSGYWSYNREDPLDKALFKLAHDKLQKDPRHAEQLRQFRAEMSAEERVRNLKT